MFLLGSNKRWFHSLAQNGMSGHRGGGTWLAHAMEPAMKGGASTVNPTYSTVNPTHQRSQGLRQRTETGNESQRTGRRGQWSQGGRRGQTLLPFFHRRNTHRAERLFVPTLIPIRVAGDRHCYPSFTVGIRTVLRGVAGDRQRYPLLPFFHRRNTHRAERLFGPTLIPIQTLAQRV